jgi:hypothetical protein
MGKQRHDYFAQISTLLLGAGKKVESSCQVFSLFFVFAITIDFVAKVTNSYQVTALYLVNLS